MKVLHILASNKYSGAENVACQIIKMFDGDIDMAYCSPNGPISKSLQDMSVPYLSISKLSKKQIEKAVKKFNPDIIHCHDLKAIVNCADIKHVKKIAHIHVNHPKMSKLSIRSLISKFAFKKYDHIFWVSDSCYNDFVFHSLFENKSTILNNIISIEDLYKKVSKLDGDYEYDIVYCGRLTEQKNPMRMIDIFEKLKQKKENIRVAVCGNGNMLEDFKKEVHCRGLEDNIEIKGFVSNPFDIIAHSKIMILTSFFEGTPMTALESLALGTPIVSTNIDGMKKLIINDYNGYLYKTDEEAVNIIIECISSDELLNKLKKNAKGFAEKYNDVNKYKTQLANAYSDEH